MKKLATILLLLISLSGFTQTVFEKIIHAHTSDSTIIALCGTQCHDGGYMLAGYCVTGWYQWQMMLMKVDSLGDPLWKKFYGALPSSYNRIYGIAQLPDSSFVCAGPGSFQEVESGQLAPNNNVIMNINKNGDLLWQREFDLGSYYDYVYNLHLGESSFVVVGSAKDTVSWNQNPSWIISDFAGENIYINTYESETDDYLKSASIDADGNFILAGQAERDAIFIKTDPFGNILNVQKVGEEYDEQFTHNDHITIGDLHYVCGSQEINSHFYPNIYTLNDNFEIQDSVVFQNEHGNSESEKIVLGKTQNIFVAGEYEDSQREHELWLMSFDHLLNLQWRRSIGGQQPEEIKDIVATKDGGCLLIGVSDSFDDWTSIYLVKTDSLGRGNYTSPVIQYTDRNIEVSVYPNPTTDYCNVDIPFESDISNLILYNLAGKQVLNQFVDQQSIRLNLESIPPGLYILSDEKQQSRTKLIVQ